MDRGRSSRVRDTELGVVQWLVFSAPLGILAVIGVEEFVAFARTFRSRLKWLALAGATVLAISSSVFGGSLPQLQTRLLLSVAIGGCAAIATEFLVPARYTRPAAWSLIALALGVSVGLLMIAPAHKFRVLVEHEFALTDEARTAFQWATYDSYRAADEDLRVLRSRDVLPGPFYVFGDPVLLLRANRQQAVPIDGWVAEYLDGKAWDEIGRDLRATLPVHRGRSEQCVAHPGAKSGYR